MKRALVAAIGIAVLWAASAMARPVRVGRYVEIPFGVSSHHPWRTGQGDPMRTARSSLRAPDRAPSKQWEARIGVGRVYAPTVAEDGTVYVGSHSGVSAVAPDGTVRWARRLGRVSGTPSLTPDGSIAFGAQPDELMIFRAAGGAGIRARIGGGVRGSPLVLDDGSVVVAAYDQAIHRFDPEGRRVFRTHIASAVRGTVARSGELLVVGVGQSLVWLSVRGSIRRVTVLGADVDLGPAIADDGVAWVVTSDGVLTAVAPTGRVVARGELGVRPSRESNIAIAPDGSVRFGTSDAGLICVGPNGTERWRLADRGALANQVTVDANGVSLTVDANGAMLAIDDDGQVMWSVELGARTSAAPVLGAGTIYVTTFGGALQAWR